MVTAVPAARARSEFAPHPGARERRRVAFVCVGNTCRSQMAEGWMRHLNRTQLGPVEVEAMSAGLYPIGYITQETIQVMQENDVSLEGQTSKGLEEIDWNRVDVLVNMTGVPAISRMAGFGGRSVEWRVEDPFNESLRVYRRVRDHLERKVKELLADLQSTTGGPASPPADRGAELE